MVDILIKRLRTSFEKIVEHRAKNCTYELQDTLMAGFSMFHLKDPSLLAYRESMPYRTENLRQIYELDEIPSDSGLRNCLDGVAPDSLKSVFKGLIEFASEEGMLADKWVLGGRYLAVPFDATGYFSSTTTNCKHCLVKNHQNGETIYHHQMLGAVIAQPPVRRTYFRSGEKPSNGKMEQLRMTANAMPPNG